MQNLFVNKSIKINALAPRVWSVLTDAEYTRTWAPEFATDGANYRIESDWKVGSAVLWKNDQAQTVVEGNVMALKPNELLRFSVFDVRNGSRARVGQQDGITFRLTERNGRTTLDVLQGDFSTLNDGKAFRDLSAAIWDRVLPKIKELAEGES